VVGHANDRPENGDWLKLIGSTRYNELAELVKASS
jgi:hypothetical protein